ncbi:MAG: hypothetical protein JKY60_02515 [Kordiimonadaceae bacterium]|nr:hypothetical protein [Kordiimonadaceae bacterium]
MPQAGNYRVTVTNKVTGAFVGVYPVYTDGTKPPESLALENAVTDGRFETIDIAHEEGRCVVTVSKH